MTIFKQPYWDVIYILNIHTQRFTRLNSVCNSVFSSIFIELCNHHYDLILEPDLLFKRSSWLLCGERIIAGEKDKRIVSGGYWRYPGSQIFKVTKGKLAFFHSSLHQLPTTYWARVRCQARCQEPGLQWWRWYQTIRVEHTAVHGLWAVSPRRSDFQDVSFIKPGRETLTTPAKQHSLLCHGVTQWQPTTLATLC